VPARLKEGVTPKTLAARPPRPTASVPAGPAAGGVAGAPGAAAASPSGVLRGRALIVWDPARPGRKRDAIDTDQITPATDCVSESLATLDERWKAGAFRHLI